MGRSSSVWTQSMMGAPVARTGTLAPICCQVLARHLEIPATLIQGHVEVLHVHWGSFVWHYDNLWHVLKVKVVALFSCGGNGSAASHTAYAWAWSEERQGDVQVMAADVGRMWILHCFWPSWAASRSHSCVWSSKVYLFQYCATAVEFAKMRAGKKAEDTETDSAFTSLARTFFGANFPLEVSWQPHLGPSPMSLTIFTLPIPKWSSRGSSTMTFHKISAELRSAETWARCAACLHDGWRLFSGPSNGQSKSINTTITI